MIDLSKVELKHGNSHDIEDVALCDFLRFFQNRIGSVLDVGAHHSYAHYARQARSVIKGKYEGIDILEDRDTALLIDKYHVGNYALTNCGRYDAIICVSTIEHSGMTTYNVDDWKAERTKIMVRMFNHSDRFVFLTFPFGQFGFVEGQYSNIHTMELDHFEIIAEYRHFKPLAYDFYFSEHPQERKPWVNISRDEASRIPLDPKIECQCIGICSWMKV